jgi:hypothetical protein
MIKGMNGKKSSTRLHTGTKHFKGLKINNGHRNLVTHRLESAYSFMINLLDRYPKLRMLHQHCVLKLPNARGYKHSEFNELRKLFFKKLSKSWPTKKLGKLHYVATTEREDEKGWHIHLHTFITKKPIKEQHKVINSIIEKCWLKTARIESDFEREIGLSLESEDTGYVHYCKVNDWFYKLLTKESEKVNDSFYWLSYILKMREGSKYLGFSTSR